MTQPRISVIEYFKTAHDFPTITSFNTARQPSQWDLGRERLCCSSQTTRPQWLTGSGGNGQGIYIIVSIFIQIYQLIIIE